MIKYLKISVIENLDNPNNVLDMQNYSSPGFFLAKDSVGASFIVQVIQNNIGLTIGYSLPFPQDTVFPLLDLEEIEKPQIDTLKKELEEQKAKYASLESEYKTSNLSCERLQKKVEEVQDSSLEACNELGKVQDELETCKIKLNDANKSIELAKKSGEEALEKEKAAYEKCIGSFRDKLTMSKELLETSKAETKEIKAKYDKDLINLSNSPIKKDGWISSKDLIEIVSILKR